MNTGEMVARVNVDNEQQAHEYFCQQYDYTKYNYTLHDYIVMFEFARH